MRARARDCTNTLANVHAHACTRLHPHPHTRAIALRSASQEHPLTVYSPSALIRPVAVALPDPTPHRDSSQSLEGSLHWARGIPETYRLRSHAPPCAVLCPPTLPPACTRGVELRLSDRSAARHACQLRVTLRRLNATIFFIVTLWHAEPCHRAPAEHAAIARDCNAVDHARRDCNHPLISEGIHRASTSRSKTADLCVSAAGLVLSSAAKPGTFAYVVPHLRETWRVRFPRADGSRPSKGGFTTAEAAARHFAGSQ